MTRCRFPGGVEQGRESPIEIEDVEEAHTLATNGPFLEGQKIEHEGGRIGGLGRGTAGRDPGGLGGARCDAQCRMHLVMIGPENLERQDALEFCEGQDCLVLGGIIAARLNVG